MRYVTHTHARTHARTHTQIHTHTYHTQEADHVTDTARITLYYNIGGSAASAQDIAALNNADW